MNMNKKTVMMSMSGSKEELLSCRDIMMEILKLLPAKSLVGLRIVCKYWLNLISDPVFIKMHLHHHAMLKQNPLHLMSTSTLMSNSSDNNHRPSLYHSLNCMNNDNNIDHGGNVASSMEIKPLFPPPPFNSPHFVLDEEDNNKTKLLTCNGLVCLIREKIESHQQLIILWNPCTNEYKELPKCLTGSPTHEDDYNYDIYYGFGYDHTTDDYKLIRNAPCFSSGDGDGDDSGGRGEGAIVHVYTLGTNSWKRLGYCPYTFMLSNINPTGVLVNENMYWLGRPPGSKTTCIFTDKANLVSFDIANEDYSGISTPFRFCVLISGEEHFCRTILIELNECLHLFNIYFTLNFIELWRISKDYGVNKEENPWSRLFRFDIFSIPCLSYRIATCKVLSIRKNGEFIMLVGEVGKINLVLYNSQNGISRILGTISPRYYEEHITFIESLVSLNSGTYNGQDDAKTSSSSSQLNNKDRSMRMD